jgi:LmbE family N-acetylglucosaminyl deacetylase
MSALDFIGSGHSVSVIVAHPDDEALTCGGSIRRLADQGASVSVLAMTDGGQGRDVVIGDACAKLIAVGQTLGFPAGRLTLDMDLIAAVDAELVARRPAVVITHAATAEQHQDHVAVRRAVERSLERWPEAVLAIGGEPASGATGWSPCVFVDITSTIEAKIAAAEVYARTGPRGYLTRGAIEARACYWGQIGFGQPDRPAEAFDLLVWR